MEENRKLTVVIAEDEYYICKLLQKIILWDELGLKLVATVSNGKELLKVIMDQSPDIVITDICMPEMDGMELIQETRKLRIPCKFIIVSGYRQFEYAYNALKYDVEDYILKPVNNDELNNVLRKIVQQLTHSTNVLKNENALLVQSSQEQIRRLFFNRVIREDAVHELALEDIADNYGIKFQAGLFRVMYVKLDVIDKPQDNIEDVNSLNKKLADLSRDILGEHCHEILIDMDSASIRIGVNYDSEKDESLRSKISEYFDYAKNVVDLFVRLKITIGVGNAFENVEQLKNSESQAIGAVLCRVVEGTDQIIYWHRLGQSSAMLSEEERKEFLEGIARAYEILDHNDFSRRINNLFSIASNRFSGYEMFDLLKHTIELYFDIQHEMLSKSQDVEYLRKQIMYGVQNSTTLMKMEWAVVEPIIPHFPHP